jgi:hypothetical protein
MSEENNKLIAIFEDHPVRRAWVEKEEKWYFSVVDIIAILTDSIDPRKYWNKLSQRLRDEGSEVVTKCHQLKLVAKDGKKYSTDAADVETVFRLVQSIPSSKAEPFKLWLAKVGYERMPAKKKLHAKTTGYKKNEFYFDDCAICRAMAKADAEDRAMTLEETKELFRKAGGTVGKGLTI